MVPEIFTAEAWQFTPAAPLYALAVVLAWTVAAISWGDRRRHGFVAFPVMMLFAGLWTLGYLFGHFSALPAVKLVMLRVEYLGAVVAVSCWLLFVARYTRFDRWIRPWSLAIVLVVPALTLVQMLVVRQHSFFYISHDYQWVDGMLTSVKHYGPGFYLWVACSWGMTVVGEVVLLVAVVRMPQRYRGQLVPLAAAFLVVLTPNIMYVTQKNPFAPLDITSASWAVVGLLFLLVLQRRRFLRWRPWPRI